MRYRAFTVAELIGGLMITGIALAAAGGILQAAADSWNATETVQSDANLQTVMHRQMQAIIGPSLRVAVPDPGSLNPAAPAQASLTLWNNDRFASASPLVSSIDKKIQIGEIGLLEFVPSEGALSFLQSKPANELNGTENDNAVREVFSSQFPTALTATRVRISPGNRGKQFMAGGTDSAVVVKAATFKVDQPTGGRPYVTYELLVERAGKTQNLTGVVMLNNPAVTP